MKFMFRMQWITPKMHCYTGIQRKGNYWIHFALELIHQILCFNEMHFKNISYFYHQMVLGNPVPCLLTGIPELYPQL